MSEFDEFTVGTIFGILVGWGSLIITMAVMA